MWLKHPAAAERALRGPEMMTTYEAARYLGLSVSTLKRWRTQERRYPRWRQLGTRKVVYMKSDLDEFLQQAVRGSVIY